jgi:iron complex outermembrane receptor protein
MQRAQGVVNVPINDRLRARFGFDSPTRDGYVNNLTSIGPEEFSNVDYLAGRASLVFDVTDAVENYTILKAVDSKNNGSPGQAFACNPQPGGLGFIFAGPCRTMLASTPKASDFYYTFSTIPNPTNELEQWQGINTTSWEVADNFSVKNILSYAHLETRNRNSTYGTDLQYPTGSGTQELIFAQTGSSPDFPTTSQESFVEEFRLQGTALDDKLSWQSGLYYEKSEPDEMAGSRYPSFISCDPNTIYGPVDGIRCNDIVATILRQPQWGTVGSQPYGITYENKAIYGQTTYDLTDRISLTGGLRYTEDKTDGHTENTFYRFPGDANGGFFPISRTQFAVVESSTSSDKPTWLAGVDFHLSEDALLYSKYSRGYRQGGINIAAPEGLQTYEPETVNTYEIGAKAEFLGSIPGQFNIAAFYNDFQNQAIQVGVLPPGEVGTTVVANIGESQIWGIEMDFVVELFDGFRLSAAYSYLDTEVKSFTDPRVDSRFDEFRANGGIVSTVNAVEGDPLPFAPENTLTMSADYQLPVAESWGELHAIATYVYTDHIQTTSPTFSPYGVLPTYQLFNFNLNWTGIGGSPVDASFFATNVLDEEYTTYVNGVWNTAGFETRYVGQPRMYGLRLRYNF